MATEAVEEASVQEVATAVNDGEGLLVDVREGLEWDQGHAAGARHIPLASLPAELATLPRESPIYLICATGNRSAKAAQYLRQVGFRRPINVRGGTIAWHRAGLPIER